MVEKIPCFIMLHGYRMIRYPGLCSKPRDESLLIRGNRICCITPTTTYESPEGASSLREVSEVVSGSRVELIDTETGYMGTQEHITFICSETPEEIMNMLMAERSEER